MRFWYPGFDDYRRSGSHDSRCRKFKFGILFDTHPDGHGMVFLFSLLGGLGIKERVTPVADAETKYSLKDYLNIFTQKPVFMYLIFAFCSPQDIICMAR